MTIENAVPFFAWDVATWLTLAVVVSFIIVTFDRLFVAKDKTDEGASEPKKSPPFNKYIYFLFFLKFSKSERYLNRPKIVQWSAELFPVLLLVFVLRGFIVEPFRIPSNSMMPTLLTGDYILVNKFIYGLRLPILNAKIIDISEPKRGDILVFRYPNYERNNDYLGTDFIKRVIGVPGDEIIYFEDHLSVNGEPIAYKDIGTYQGVESGFGMTGFKHKRELLNTHSYDILLNPYNHSKPVKIKVPQGHYFVMGDNRSRSSDSRFWGFVPEQYIIGKAFAIWMHWDHSIKTERIGSIITKSQ